MILKILLKILIKDHLRDLQKDHLRDLLKDHQEELIKRLQEDNLFIGQVLKIEKKYIRKIKIFIKTQTKDNATWAPFI